MSNRLLYTTFFPPREGQAWRYYIPQTIREIPRVVKAMYQRATRGWAWCDVWSIDCWFQRIMPEMLRHLADTTHGTPCSFFPNGMLDNPNLPETERELIHEEWLELLRQMADDLETHTKFWDEVCTDKYEGLAIEDFAAKEDEALKKVHDAVLQFHKYFFALWD